MMYAEPSEMESNIKRKWAPIRGSSRERYEFEMYSSQIHVEKPSRSSALEIWSKRLFKPTTVQMFPYQLESRSNCRNSSQSEYNGTNNHVWKAEGGRQITKSSAKNAQPASDPDGSYRRAEKIEGKVRITHWL